MQERCAAVDMHLPGAHQPPSKHCIIKGYESHPVCWHMPAYHMPAGHACPAAVCYNRDMCPAAPLHSTSYNFPSLLEEGSLLEELQGCEDWEAMQEVAESWLEGHWAAKGPQLVAGRAEALARQVGAGGQHGALTARACFSI